jgi:hypothetical protein
VIILGGVFGPLYSVLRRRQREARFAENPEDPEVCRALQSNFSGGWWLVAVPISLRPPPSHTPARRLLGTGACSDMVSASVCRHLLPTRPPLRRLLGFTRYRLASLPGQALAYNQMKVSGGRAALALYRCHAVCVYQFVARRIFLFPLCWHLVRRSRAAFCACAWGLEGIFHSAFHSFIRHFILSFFISFFHSSFHFFIFFCGVFVCLEPQGHSRSGSAGNVTGTPP